MSLDAVNRILRIKVIGSERCVRERRLDRGFSIPSEETGDKTMALGYESNHKNGGAR